VIVLSRPGPTATGLLCRSVAAGRCAHVARPLASVAGSTVLDGRLGGGHHADALVIWILRSTANSWEALDGKPRVFMWAQAQLCF
jgi:hypothetical protein